jgi:brefeldin A-inhibited guanine nucleotide-exchange protein
VFVTNIFLKILDSENSTFDHKMRTLEVLCMMCQDSQVEIAPAHDSEDETDTSVFTHIIAQVHSFYKSLKSTYRHWLRFS